MSISHCMFSCQLREIPSLAYMSISHCMFSCQLREIPSLAYMSISHCMFSCQLREIPSLACTEIKSLHVSFSFVFVRFMLAANTLVPPRAKVSWLKTCLSTVTS